MRQYISEDRAIYEDMYHGQFSRKLAMWAIGNMEMKDAETGRMKPVPRRALDNVAEIFSAHGVEIPDECFYTAYYLFHMAIADYPKSLPDDGHRAMFVKETLCDPDGDPTSVLACFETKMCNAGIPVYFERFL